MKSSLEKQFHQDMVSIYTTAKKECRYVASRFLQLVSSEGGLRAAKQLTVPDTSDSVHVPPLRDPTFRTAIMSQSHRSHRVYESADEEIALCCARLQEFHYSI